ncbi:MAG: endonuclease/exonuclease/phosphatase family protein [Verrucomicrobiota bacterium]|jgi:endonuclease/exonuclease/phosphatase family metal-dependent hydrolase
MTGPRIWLVLLLWFPAALWAGPQVLRVATYNVENYLDAPSGTRHAKPPEAAAKVRQSILALHPDVIALQEVGSSNVLLELQAGLKSAGLDLPFWERVAGFDTNIHVCVLSRFPIVARHPHTNESFLLDGRRMAVSRGFAEVEIQVNPAYAFTLIAAHLKSRRPSPLADEEEWRYEEAVALRAVIDARLAAKPEQDLVVLGDLNDNKDSKPVRAILGQGAARLFDTRPAERNGDDDTKREAGHETRRVTWTHYYATEDVYSRIDYILLNHAMHRHWLAGETYILASPNWGLASDHRPLIAGFAVPDR